MKKINKQKLVRKTFWLTKEMAEIIERMAKKLDVTESHIARMYFRGIKLEKNEPKTN